MDTNMIERMASEALLAVKTHDGKLIAKWQESVDLTQHLAIFAALVAEECARVVEAERLEGPPMHLDDVGYQDAISDAAAAIRTKFLPSR